MTSQRQGDVSVRKSWLAGAFEALSGRKVFRAAAAYAVAAWILTEVSATVLPLFGAPDSLLRIIVVVLIVGFPLALILSWVFDISSSGITRTRDAAPVSGRARRIDLAIIAVLVAVVAYLLYERLLAPDTTVEPAAAAPAIIDEIETKEPPSIAVLPFENFSTDPANEIFGDGLAEELLNRLGRLDGLHVVARTSAFKFRGTNLDIREIGEALDVTTVLEGSVRASGDTIRVTAKLIATETGYRLWSETYNKKMIDLFALQDEIARAVAGELEVQLLGRTQEILTAKPTQNIDAWRFYLRGRRAWHERTSASVDTAVTLFQSAIDLDPDFALAWSGLADSYNFMGSYGNMAKEDSVSKSEAAARKALELDPNLAEAHASLGLVYQDQMRFEQAGNEFSKAVELKPNFAMAQMWLGSVLYWVDKEGGLARHRIAAELDPLSPIANQLLGSSLFGLGKVEEARNQFLKITEFAPDFPLVYFDLAEIARNENDYPAAVSYLLKANELDPGRATTLAVLAGVYLDLGDTRAAREWTEKAQEIGPEQVTVIIAKLNLLFVARDWDGIELLISEKLIRGQDMFIANVYRGSAAYGRGKYALAARTLDGVFANIAARQEGAYEKYLVADPTMYGLLYLASAMERNGERDEALAIVADLLGFLDARAAAGIERNDYLLVRAGALLTKGDENRAMDVIRQLAERGWPGYLRLETDTLFEPLRNELEYKLSIDFIRKNAATQLSQI